MPPSTKVDVSVVIPSVGRPELQNAINSATSQNYEGTIEVIVAFDLAEQSVSKETLAAAAGADRVVFTGGGKRGGYARNLGVETAKGEWIAFLDDDDTWFPDKLRVQMAAAAAHPNKTALVVGSRAVQTITGSSQGAQITGVPANLIRPNEDIAHYLFRRRRAGSRRASFFASAVLAPKSLCSRVKWDESLRRHQDWDWLLRLGQQPEVQFIQVEEDLVNIFVGTSGSISAGSDWTSSLAWAKSAFKAYHPQTFVDFVAGQTLRYAIQKRDVRGITASVSEIARYRRFPSPSPLLLALSGVLPRTLIQRMMRVIK